MEHFSTIVTYNIQAAKRRLLIEFGNTKLHVRGNRKVYDAVFVTWQLVHFPSGNGFVVRVVIHIDKNKIDSEGASRRNTTSIL